MTTASARLTGWPMQANTIRTSATPMIQPRHVHDGAGEEIGTTGVDRGEVLVDGIDRAEHPPLSVAGKAPDDDVQNALPAATLHQIEAGEHDSAKAQAGRGHPSQRRVRSERDQQQEGRQ